MDASQNRQGSWMTTLGFGLSASAVLAIAFAISCSEPTSSNPPAVPPKDTVVANIEVVWPPSLLVNQSALLNVIARNAAGESVRVPTVEWSSSDESVARVAYGVTTGLRRGYATIEATAGRFRVTHTIRVTARVKVKPAFAYGLGQIAIGDTIQFVAAFVDFDGYQISEAPSPEWASSDSSVVSVSATGLVVGRRFVLSPPPCPCDSAVSLTASTEDGPGTFVLRVSNVVAGLPATLRLVHANPDANAFTFSHNRGAPVTLRFGESAQVPITSGTFALQAEGLPFGNTGASGTAVTIIRPGDEFSLYAVGDSRASALVQAFAEDAIIHPDSGRVRFVQGYTDFYVVYLRSVGAPRSGIPEQCYFDPGNLSQYYSRAAGEFDVLLMQKFATPDFVRLRATALAGDSHTFVIVRDGTGARLLGFRDR